jgi:DNA-binding CsgD family transcriptional regulator
LPEASASADERGCLMHREPVAKEKRRRTGQGVGGSVVSIVSHAITRRDCSSSAPWTSGRCSASRRRMSTASVIAASPSSRRVPGLSGPEASTASAVADQGGDVEGVQAGHDGEVALADPLDGRRLQPEQPRPRPGAGSEVPGKRGGERNVDGERLHLDVHRTDAAEELGQPGLGVHPGGSGPGEGRRGRLAAGYVAEALTAGAVGFLLKATGPADLIHAIRVAARGESILAPSIVRRLVERHLMSTSDGSGDAGARLAPLTPTERDVLRQVGTGASNADIADTLFMGVGTVKAHLSRILTKLGCENRVQAAILAHEAGLLTDRTPAFPRPSTKEPG